MTRPTAAGPPLSHGPRLPAKPEAFQQGANPNHDALAFHAELVALVEIQVDVERGEKEVRQALDVQIRRYLPFPNPRVQELHDCILERLIERVAVELDAATAGGGVPDRGQQT